MRFVVSVLLFFVASLWAKDLVPNKTHAVLNVTYTNFEDLPHRNKTLVFVGQKNSKKKITVQTDAYGEVSFLIPREDSYTIFCESLTGPFECGTTPYVSLKASTGGISVAFDDTRAELTGVTFDVGKSTLVPGSLKTLNQAVEGLKKNKSARIEVEGHTSSEGGDEFNQKLSEDRAKSVRNYMISKGIAPERITAVGYGYSKPRAGNDTESGRKQNRRIEIRLLESSAQDK